jgi:ABC-type glycerol-3-phosphate transport system substrate-binding protein
MEPVELAVWLSYYTEGENKKAYTDELNSRMESDIGVRMNITGVPYVDAPQKFRAAQASGNIPHLVEVMTHPELMAGGGAQDITNLFEGSESSDIVSEKVMDFHRTWGAQSTGEDGNLVTWPLGLRPFYPTWRTDWLDQAGLDYEVVDASAGAPSKDYYGDTGDPADDLQALYQALLETDLGQTDGNYPDTTGMKQSDEEYLAMYFPQFGGSLTGAVNKTGNAATINTPEAVAAIQMQVEFIEKGYFNPNALNIGDEESTTLQWGGRHAGNHIQDSTDLWADYLQEQPDAMENGEYRWDVPFNAKSKGGQVANLMWLPCLMFTGGGDWNEARTSAAVELMDYWVAQPENSLGNAQQLGWVPLDPAAIDEEDYFGQTDMHDRFWRGAGKRTLAEAVPGSIPAVPSAGAITYDIPFRMHQRILQQGVPIQEAADQAAADINDLLAEAGRR